MAKGVTDTEAGKVVPGAGIEPATRGFFNPLLYQLSYPGLRGRAENVRPGAEAGL